MPHQLEALTPEAMIFEVSTPDSVEDNYRIIPGDSQLQDSIEVVDPNNEQPV